MNHALVKRALSAVGLYRPAWLAYRRLTGGADLRGASEHYRRFVAPGDLVFDVGVNIGRKAEVFLGLGATVVAVEPQPDCRRELLARLGDDRRLIVVPKGVGSAPGVARMHLNSRLGSVVGSLRDGWTPDPDRAIDVELTTLDRLIAEHGRPSFVKVDVEGFELEVLRGLSRPVPALSFEYQHGALDLTRGCLAEVARLGAAEVNFTPFDEPRFLFDDWVPLAEAPRRLDEAVALCPWGDLFVVHPAAARAAG